MEMKKLLAGFPPASKNIQIQILRSNAVKKRLALKIGADYPLVI